MAEAHLTSQTAVPKTRAKRSRPWGIICWLYWLALIGLIVYLRTQGDRAWLPTILIFSPRWIYVLPMLLLLPAVRYRNCVLPMLFLVLTALFPLMGFCIGWQRFVGDHDTGLPIRIVTFNLHQTPLTAPGMKEFLAESHADVLAFEEMPDHASRRDLPSGLTHSARHGSLFIASRYPIRVVKVLIDEIAIRYTLDTPAGPVDLIGVHLSSPHWALRDSIDGTVQGPTELAGNIADRRAEAELLRAQIERPSNRPVMIAGDFNLVPDSPLFMQNFSAMSDAFESSGLGFGWTYFHQHAWVRIDHVMSNSFALPTACRVGPYLGSPHRPLIVDLVLKRQ